jgi:glycosyltransferase involved in cell wall biosynthesis
MSFRKVKSVDIEVSRPFGDLRRLENYASVRALVRVGGVPVGFVNVGVVGDHVAAGTLRRVILEELAMPIIRRCGEAALEKGPLPASGIPITSLLELSQPENKGPFPLVTVAVCTRNRTEDLAICLRSLVQIDYPNLELLVVDNAPPDESTRKLVESQFPLVRYVCEPRPGLDWARNRAVLVAKGEIIAYTDDDVVVDPGWVKALVARFSDGPEVMCVTGLVVAHEIETEAQELFELYGGFARGFQRGWFRKPNRSRRDDDTEVERDRLSTREAEKAVERKFGRAARKAPYYGTGFFGTGCNMAYRRSFLEPVGGFDPALDVGTSTNGGGDLEMYFRVLREGYTLAYEPSAIVRHRHRREREKLATQIRSNGVGLYSYFLRIVQKYPDERLPLAKFAIWWFWFWSIRRLLISLYRPASFPRDLILAELLSVFEAPRALKQSRARAAEIAKNFPGEPRLRRTGAPVAPVVVSGRWVSQAVRIVELTQPLRPLTDISEYPTVLVLISLSGRVLGQFGLPNYYQPCGVVRLRNEIVKHIPLQLVEPYADSCGMLTYQLVLAQLLRQMEGGSPGETTATPPQVPAHIPVSIIVATCNRPDDLRECLTSLTTQNSPRPIEIIVVDNRPESGITPKVVAEFPTVKLLNEERPGVSYARNTGFAAATSPIILSTDDDVTAPPDWVERIVAPFARNDVMLVCGNVIPRELETPAQQLYETYGGLGRGFVRREVDGSWFRTFKRRSVPVWSLGATANNAFRAEVMRDPRVGMLEECLGCGMPCEGSEDNYFLYKALKADMIIVYEPAAHVYHGHRRDIKALKRQLHGYSKGFVAFHILQLTRDHDFRALFALFILIPQHFFNQAWRWIRGHGDYPLGLLLHELTGWLVAPWALWQSLRRVKKFGPSRPMPPAVEQRGTGSALPVSDLGQHALTQMSA